MEVTRAELLRLLRTAKKEGDKERIRNLTETLEQFKTKEGYFISLD